jgi:hypothetical protein
MTHPFEKERLSAELRWYYREAEGDMGLRSNYGPMVAALQGVLGGGGPLKLELDGRHVAAAARARRVRTALEQLVDAQRQVLRVSYAHPGGALDLVGLMCLAQSASTEWRLSRTTRTLPDWLQRLGRHPTTWVRQQLYERLRHEAQALLEEALDAYSKARRR